MFHVHGDKMQGLLLHKLKLIFCSTVQLIACPIRLSLVLKRLAVVRSRIYGLGLADEKLYRNAESWEDVARNLMLGVRHQGNDALLEFFRAINVFRPSSEPTVELRRVKGAERLRAALARKYDVRRDGPAQGPLSYDHNQIYLDLDTALLNGYEIRQLTKKVSTLRRFNSDCGVASSNFRSDERRSKPSMTTLAQLVAPARAVRTRGGAPAQDNLQKYGGGTRVLLGQGGCGKTTMVTEVAKGWSETVLDGPVFDPESQGTSAYLKRKAELSRYDFVFVVPARNLTEANGDNVFSLLNLHHYLSAEEVADVLPHLKDNADRVLILLDGADEMGSSLSKSKAVEDLLDGPSLSGRTLLVTSRVSDLADRFMKEACSCAMILELTDEQLDSMVRLRLNAKYECYQPNPVEQLHKAWQEALDTRLQYIRPLLHTPMLAGLFIEMFTEEIYTDHGYLTVDSALASSPASLTNLHKKLAVEIVKRAENINCELQCDFSTSDSVDCIACYRLEKLRELALHSMLNCHYAFTEKQLESQDCLDVVKWAADIGLMVRYHTKPHQREDVFHFCHMHFQELFAAQAIAHSANAFASARKCLELLCPEKERARGMFWQFLAAIIPVGSLQSLLTSLMKRAGPSLAVYRSLLALVLSCIMEAAAAHSGDELSLSVVRQATDALLPDEDLNFSRWNLDVRHILSLLCTLNTGNSTVNRISLRNCNLGLQHAKALAGVQIVSTHNITELDLSFNDGLCGKPLEIIAKVLSPSQKLKVLVVRYCKLSASDGKTLGEMIAKNSSIVELNLRKNDLGSKGCMAILDGCLCNSTLLIINLSGNAIGCEGAVAVASALSSPKCCLKELRLGDTGITPEGQAKILSSIRSQPKSQLTYVDLSFNSKCDGRVIDSLVALQERPYASLGRPLLVKMACNGLEAARTRLLQCSAQVAAEASVAIDLGPYTIQNGRPVNRDFSSCGLLRRKPTVWNMINWTVMDAWARWWENPQFQSDDGMVNLFHEGIQDEGACVVAKIVSQNPHVVSLDLGKNGITDHGISEITAELSRLNDKSRKGHLRAISLRMNDLTKASLPHLVVWLSQPKTVLTVLDICCNPIFADKQPLAEKETHVLLTNLLSSAVCPSLRVLHLGRTCLEDQDAAVIGRCLAENKSLVFLNLRGNLITSTGVAHFARGIAKNYALQLLSLSENRIGNDGVCALSIAQKQRRRPLKCIWMGMNEADTSQYHEAMVNDCCWCVTLTEVLQLLSDVQADTCSFPIPPVPMTRNMLSQNNHPLMLAEESYRHLSSARGTHGIKNIIAPLLVLVFIFVAMILCVDPELTVYPA